MSNDDGDDLLRDVYAGLVLFAFSIKNPISYNSEHTARVVWDIADAMVAERKDRVSSGPPATPKYR